MSFFVIARHGNTFPPGTSPRRIGARTDLPLTPEGQAQAERLADAFAMPPLRPDLVLCGPLQRSRSTAAIICERLGLGVEPVAVEWLNEIDHGPDEGRSDAEIIDRVGADALAAWDRDGTPPMGWAVDADARIAAWRSLLSSPSANTILMVTSNGAARFALRALPSAPLPPSIRLRTGAYGIIECRGAGQGFVRGWDRRP